MRNQKSNRIVDISKMIVTHSKTDNLPISMNNQIELQHEVKTCRICLNEESSDNKFTYPCKCNGTIKYIHDSCLKDCIKFKNRGRLQSIKLKSVSIQKCDICKDSFYVFWERQNSALSCNSIYQTRKLPIFCLFIALCISIGAVCALVRLKDRELTEDRWDALQTSIIICFTLLFIFIFGCSAIIISSCFFYRKIIISKINPIEKQKLPIIASSQQKV